MYVSIHVCVRHSTGLASIGVNPKINNMIAASRAAQFNLLWISDASIMSKYEYINGYPSINKQLGEEPCIQLQKSGTMWIDEM